MNFNPEIQCSAKKTDRQIDFLGFLSKPKIQLTVLTFTPVSFSYTILFKIGGTINANESTKNNGRMKPRSRERLLLKYGG